MRRFWFFTFIVLLAEGALAHPGHGKPGILHSHPLGEFGDWMANAAWVLLAGCALAVVIWALARLWRFAVARRKP